MGWRGLRINEKQGCLIICRDLTADTNMYSSKSGVQKASINLLNLLVTDNNKSDSVWLHIDYKGATTNTDISRAKKRFSVFLY